MARYIDADEMLQFIDEQNIENDWLLNQYSADWISSFIENRPTEDVVPRSEVEKLTEERDRYKKYYYRHEYDEWEAEIKQEVAKEIFKELDEVFLTIPLKDGEKATLVDFKRYAELEKKYIGE